MIQRRAQCPPGLQGIQRRRDERGTVSVLAAVAMLALLGVGALAIEVANLTLARNEMQNAADATAMAGAACLLARTECGNTNVKGPDWSTAMQWAQGFVSRNAVQGQPLSTAVVEAGYWNMLDPSVGLQPTSITPSPYDYPAIRVTVRRDAGVNGGLLYAPMNGLLGSPAAVMQASAVSVLSHPGAATPGTLFPMVISTCMYNTYWDTATASPKLATQTTVPGLNLPQVIGQPYFFQMTSTYQAGPCAAGQWSSFNSDNNSASYLRQLITGGNTLTLSIGDDTWVQPGAQTTLYGDVNNCSEAGNKSCAYVMVPVVDQVNTHVYAPIQAFACLHILSATGGSSKYVVAQMSNSESLCPRLGSGVGPNYGITTPPRLVQ